jgi:hypothetical protein
MLSIAAFTRIVFDNIVHRQADSRRVMVKRGRMRASDAVCASGAPAASVVYHPVKHSSGAFRSCGEIGMPVSMMCAVGDAVKDGCACLCSANTTSGRREGARPVSVWQGGGSGRRRQILVRCRAVAIHGAPRSAPRRSGSIARHFSKLIRRGAPSLSARMEFWRRTGGRQRPFLGRIWF